jgi:soluble lytic murein transglycosylase-like protein
MWLKQLIAIILVFATVLSVSGFFYAKSATPTTSQKDPYCFEITSEQSGIPSALLKAVSYVESRHKTDAVNFNTNGSVDYGHMQINSLWVSQIGETYLDLIDPCYCTQVGAYVLLGCIKRYGYTADAISCYNTGRPLNQLSSPKKAAAEKYVKKVFNHYKFITSGASTSAK